MVSFEEFQKYPGPTGMSALNVRNLSFKNRKFSANFDDEILSLKVSHLQSLKINVLDNKMS